MQSDTVRSESVMRRSEKFRVLGFKSTVQLKPSDPEVQANQEHPG